MNYEVKKGTLEELEAEYRETNHNPYPFDEMIDIGYNFFIPFSEHQKQAPKSTVQKIQASLTYRVRQYRLKTGDDKFAIRSTKLPDGVRVWRVN